MAGTPFVIPTGGFWPLGKITIATAGTPVPINTNVGAQGQGTSQGAGQPLKMSSRIRGLMFSQPLTTTTGKKIYVMKAGYKATQTNGIIAVITCGTSTVAATDPQPILLPPGCLLDGAMPTIDFFTLDADESGASVQVTAIYG